MTRRNIKKDKREVMETPDSTPQNGKQILIGTTAETLSRTYRRVLLEKDALGSNSIRIQAKNNKTLNTIATNLAELEGLVGPFQGVRVSQAVRTGAMKKGVNVLLVLKTVDDAFRAINFMAQEGFKVQTVIPRRLRETYGIHNNGMELTKPGHMVPLEIPENELPPELQKPLNTEPSKKSLKPKGNVDKKQKSPKEKRKKSGTTKDKKNGDHKKTGRERSSLRERASPGKDRRKQRPEDTIYNKQSRYDGPPSPSKFDNGRHGLEKRKRLPPSDNFDRFRRDDGSRSSHFGRKDSRSPHPRNGPSLPPQEISPRFQAATRQQQTRSTGREMQSSRFSPHNSPIRTSNGSSYRNSPELYNSPNRSQHRASPEIYQASKSSNRFSESNSRFPKRSGSGSPGFNSVRSPSSPLRPSTSRSEPRSPHKSSPRRHGMGSPRRNDYASSPHRNDVITREDFGTRVSKTSSQNDRFPKRQPSFEKRNSGGLRIPPPGFQEAMAMNKLSADAPVFTPTNFSVKTGKPATQNSPLRKERVRMSGEDRRADGHLWDQMLFMRNGTGSTYKKSGVSRANEDLIWSSRERNISPTYQPPRIYPGLFPPPPRYDSELTFNEELYRSHERHEEEIWARNKYEARHKHETRRFGLNDTAGYGYASDTSSDDNLDKHLNFPSYGMEDSLGLKYYSSQREGTPPNFMFEGATERPRRRFDPYEFYKEELLPGHMRRDPTHYKREQKIQVVIPQAPKSNSSGSSTPPQRQNSVATSNSSDAVQDQKSFERMGSPPPTKNMTGLHFVAFQHDILKFAELHEKDILEKLSHKELVYETESYYIWKYMCHVIGVEISWKEADALKTQEIVDKAKKHVQNLKDQVYQNIKLEFVDDGIIVSNEYGDSLDEEVLNLQRIIFENPGKDPFEVLKQVTPDRRPKFKDPEAKESESESSEKSNVDMNKPENWAVMLPEDNVQIILYDCDYCRKRGLKSEGHWEMNCYYYLTGCCPLCGSEEHISPYCTNPPEELTFHQSVMYVRQLAFYYGPPMLDYFPNIYHTLQSQFNDLVVWDPIQKRLVAQPIVTSEPVILWRHYDENGQMQVPLMRSPFGGKSPLPSPMMSPSICFNNEDKAVVCGKKVKPSPLNSPSIKRMKDSEQLEEIVDLELDDLEDPFTIGEIDDDSSFDCYDIGVNDIFPVIPEYAEMSNANAFPEAEELDASPVLHPLQQRSGKGHVKSDIKPVDSIIPYNKRGLGPKEHIDLINARSVVPLTLPNTALDPIPFPNLPPADRNELIRRIQSGEFASENLVYPIFPVPSSTMIITLESSQG